ncbi:MAG: phasin family protein [Methylocella sp.]
MEKSAQAKPAATRMNGATHDVAINGVAINGTTPAIKTIQAFAREIGQMSGEAIVRSNRHVKKLRRARSREEAASIQADFLKESMEHAVLHTRKYILMLTTFPHELVRPVNVAVETAEAARNAAAAKVGRLSEVSHKA